MMLLGNFFSLCSALCLCYSTFGRSKNQMLLWQTVNTGFYATSAFLLGGYSAVVTNLLTALRNILQMKGKLTLRRTVLLCVLMTGVSLFFNRRGWVGVLPVTASVSYTLLLYRVRTVPAMQASVACNMAQWAVFDWAIRAYPSFFIDLVIVALSLWNMLRSLKSPSA